MLELERPQNLLEQHPQLSEKKLSLREETTSSAFKEKTLSQRGKQLPQDPTVSQWKSQD